MNPHDSFEWANAAIGAVALLLTIAATIQATGAKAAAQKAEGSILGHNAESDFTSLARMAKELHGYVESGSMPEARLRTTDLRADLAIAIRRHDSFLGSGLKDLKARQIDLKLITDGLNRAGSALSNSEKIRLLGIAGAILEVLANQCGELQSKVERKASDA